MSALNPVRKFLPEIFKEAEESSDTISVIQGYMKNDPRILPILGYAINPKFAIHTQIPEGNPPYQESDLPLGLAHMNVLDLHNKLYVMFNPNLKMYKKEEMFIKWCEAMHPTDTKILIAIKDQNLESLYPKLTKDVIRRTLGWSEEAYKNLFNN